MWFSKDIYALNKPFIHSDEIMIESLVEWLRQQQVLKGFLFLFQKTLSLQLDPILFQINIDSLSLISR